MENCEFPVSKWSKKKRIQLVQCLWGISDFLLKTYDRKLYKWREKKHTHT